MRYQLLHHLTESLKDAVVVDSGEVETNIDTFETCVQQVILSALSDVSLGLYLVVIGQAIALVNKDLKLNALKAEGSRQLGQN